MTIHRTIFEGSLWAVGMRWGVRLIGLGSVVVLARLLRPEDFGILAMAMLVVGLLESISELGVQMMLIRDARVTRDDLDTAWTLRILQGAGLGAMVALMAFPAADYFREPRLATVVLLCALALPIAAFENIGIVLIRKELDFARDFRYQIFVKITTVAATIVLALALRSYWALAIAQPVGALANVAVSYVMSPFRPRFGLRGWRRFLGFSVSIVLSSVARFLAGKADVFLVGSIASSTQMGFYNVSSELSAMPSKELTQSVGRALFPSLARLRNDRADVLATFVRVIASVAALALPIGLGLCVVAEDFVRVVLGAQWEAAARLFSYLAIYGMLSSLVDIMIGHVLIVSGHERRQAMALWVRCALLAACAAAGVPWGVDGIAIGATVSSALMFLVAVPFLRSTLPLSMADIAACFWRPTLAALGMAVIVHFVILHLPVPPLVRLLAAVTGGIVSYAALLLALWLLAGRPPGAEAAVIATLRSGHRAMSEGADPEPGPRPRSP